MAITKSASQRDAHFSDEDWVDFDLHPRETARIARLRRHLESGCGRCSESLRFWRSVRAVAEREAAYRPPRAALAQARAFRALHGVEATGAALVFDSLHQPLPAGVRAGGSSPRQLLYKGGRYTVKLQLEAGAGSNRTSIIGQLYDDQDPTRFLQDIVVLALKGSKTLDRTLTNRYGEFQLEPDAADAFQLSVGVPEIGTFTVQSDGPAADVAAVPVDGPDRRADARGR